MKEPKAQERLGTLPRIMQQFGDYKARTQTQVL